MVAIAIFLICLFTLLLQGFAQKNVNTKSNRYSIKTYQSDTLEIEKADGTFDLRILQRANDTIYETADIMPEFYGGENALMAFISENLKYPQTAVQKGISGKVVVNFTIDKKGEIWDVKALRTPPNGEDLGREAIRVVRKMPKWKPGSNKGKPESVSFNLPILFSLK